MFVLETIFNHLEINECHGHKCGLLIGILRRHIDHICSDRTPCGDCS